MLRTWENIPSTSLVRYSAQGDVLWSQALDDFSPAYALSTDADGNAWAAGMATDNTSGYLAVSTDGSAFLVGPTAFGTSATFITHVVP